MRDRYPDADFAAKDAVVRTSVLTTLKKADSGYVQVSPAVVPPEVVRALGLSAKEEKHAVWFTRGGGASGAIRERAAVTAGAKGSSSGGATAAPPHRPDVDGDIVMVDSGDGEAAEGDDNGDGDGDDDDDDGGDGRGTA